MRTTFMIGLAAAAAVSLQLVAATQRQTTTAERELVAIDDQRMDALRRGDPVPLETIYADDYSLVTGRGEVRSKADQIAELKSGQLHYATIDSVDRMVRLYGDDVGVIISRQRAEIFQNGQRIASGDERVTRVYKKIRGSWQVIATHATPIR